MWVQVRKSSVKPFSNAIHKELEELYKSHCQLIEMNPHDETLYQTKYQMNGQGVCLFPVFYFV